MTKTVDIEVILHNQSSIAKDSVKIVIQKYLEENQIRPNTVLNEFQGDLATFHSLVKCIMIGDVSNSDNVNGYVDFKTIGINWFIYSLDHYGTIQSMDSDEEGQEITLASYLTLPSLELFTLWETLYYDDNIKENLLKYAQTIMEFSCKGINANIVSCNKVILLHGPPGTGKTSLCKALAQKLTVKLEIKFNSGILIEINSHSLFSKWFSESGKLVNKMFSKIREACENEKVLVCVLIDEVESLVHARDQCISGNEPSDSIRVVNAMLTQIDQIKKFPNVMILATSNMTEAIDLAFVDRADIKQFLGLPSIPAIYKIYHSCLSELMKVNIINSDCTLAGMEVFAQGDTSENEQSANKLVSLCKESVGLSGRVLRKIPFLAHALFLSFNAKSVSLDQFVEAMSQAVQKEHQNKKDFIKN